MTTKISGRTTNGLLTAGIVAAVGIRGGLLVLSFGVLGPAFGVEQIAGGIIIDAVSALLLVGAALALVAADRLEPRRAARYTHLLGWIYVVDNLIYMATVSAFYATSDAVDGSRWFGAIPTACQVPLLVLASMIVCRTAWAVRKPIRLAS